MSTPEYFAAAGLDQLINGNTPEDVTGAIAPDTDDLSRLHQLLRKRRVSRVLEFGVGFSTLAIADALAKNAADFAGTDGGREPVEAHRVTSVDTNEAWIALSAQRIPEGLRSFVTFHHSTARAGTFNGQLCHYYDALPPIVPEFVYLDGPDPKEVAGTVNGIGFVDPGRTPLAADLLLLEPSFLPGTMILVDGRTNNVRFLANNFRRPWQVCQDPDGRFATFELDELPLGARNRARLAFCRGEDA